MRMPMVRDTTGNEPRLYLNDTIVSPSSFNPAPANRSNPHWPSIWRYWGSPYWSDFDQSIISLQAFVSCVQVSFVCSSEDTQNRIEIFSHQEDSPVKCDIDVVSEWNLFNRLAFSIFSKFRILWLNKEQSLNKLKGVEDRDQFCWRYSTYFMTRWGTSFDQIQ
jgi:hypothetical protein